MGLHQLLDFDFTGFSKMLISENELVISTYYVGKIRTDGTDKTKKLFDDHQKLLGYLKKHNYKYSSILIIEIIIMIFYTEQTKGLADID